MTLTPAFTRELLAQHSGETALLLLTLTHASFAGPVRLVKNTVNVTSRGNVYTAFPFDIPLPADVGESLKSLQLVISNVTRTLIEKLRTISGPIECTLEMVAASAPDAVQQGPYSFDLDQATYNTETISATLSPEPVTREPFPAGRFTPEKFPGLHGDL